MAGSVSQDEIALPRVIPRYFPVTPWPKKLSKLWHIPVRHCNVKVRMTASLLAEKCIYSPTTVYVHFDPVPREQLDYPDRVGSAHDGIHPGMNHHFFADSMRGFHTCQKAYNACVQARCQTLPEADCWGSCSSVARM